mmetsp:Transcript_46548/g.115445  ORF Transcript_46548/g.115445 Transcript_46548/m.115445 type:complete len:92 (-) Transcript_46548:442-717(-)
MSVAALLFLEQLLRCVVIRLCLMQLVHVFCSTDPAEELKTKTAHRVHNTFSQGLRRKCTGRSTTPTLPLAPMSRHEQPGGCLSFPFQPTSG